MRLANPLLTPALTLLMLLGLFSGTAAFCAEDSTLPDEEFRQRLEVEIEQISVEEAERIAKDTERLIAENPRRCDQERVSATTCRMILNECDWVTLEGKPLILCIAPNPGNRQRQR